MTKVLPDPNRAIYIDFEGNQDAVPTLLGVLWQRGWDTEFEQFVLEDTFRKAARAKRCRVSTLNDVMTHVVAVAESEDVEIVAWSHHELDVIEELAAGDLPARFKNRFRDAKKIAKRWLRQCHPDVEPPPRSWGGRYRLDFFFDQTAYEVPGPLGPGNTGQRLKYVRDMLVRRKGDFKQLTPVAKGKWTRVLGHNRHDCFGMRHVDETAVMELA